MDREILFKAKRKEWKELPKEEWWVEGYYTFYPQGLSGSEKGEAVIRDTKELIGKLYFVDAETVCQYVGLTDNTKWEQLSESEKNKFLSEWNYKKECRNVKEDWNGRKIFEGDILFGQRYHDWGQGGEYIPDKCVIKWNNKRVAFDPLYWWEGDSHDLKDYKIIGNIFDNPKLVEEG